MPPLGWLRWRRERRRSTDEWRPDELHGACAESTHATCPAITDDDRAHHAIEHDHDSRDEPGGIGSHQRQ